MKVRVGGAAAKALKRGNRVATLSQILLRLEVTVDTGIGANRAGVAADPKVLLASYTNAASAPLLTCSCEDSSAASSTPR